eukprot:215957-Hanusia_phi.AAC.2
MRFDLIAIISLRYISVISNFRPPPRPTHGSMFSSSQKRDSGGGRLPGASLKSARRAPWGRSTGDVVEADLLLYHPSLLLVSIPRSAITAASPHSDSCLGTLSPAVKFLNLHEPLCSTTHLFRADELGRAWGLVFSLPAHPFSSTLRQAGAQT